jgi:site-specific recombinase XerD
MTETIDRIYFGGKGYQALAWEPLPFMEEYLAELAAGETPRSPSYLRPVKAGLARFAMFAASEGIMHPAEITRVHILRYQAYLMTIESERGNRLDMTYQRQLLKYLRGWLSWLGQARCIGSNPWLDIRLGPVAKQPKPLDGSEIEDLFAAHRSQAFSIPPFAFHRREVILVLLFGWGLRVRQLQSLNVSQMAATRDKVTVRDNRGGTKTFAYGPLPKASAGRWLRHRGVHAKFGEDALLIDQSGGRLSVDRIRAIVVDCGVRGGVTISPHRLSDTLGASLVDTTLPFERIMRLVGHADSDQTRRSRESAASPASA